jgi:cytochrome c-type biogenesis protein CcmE
MSEVSTTEAPVRKKRNNTYIIGVVVILGFVALAIPGLMSSMTKYVENIPEVSTKYAGQTIQVRGELIKDQITYDQSGAMVFFIKDEAGNKLKCRYSGTRPGNLDQAPWVVVQGAYENGIFQTKNLIVKCPDKYEGEQSK